MHQERRRWAPRGAVFQEDNHRSFSGQVSNPCCIRQIHPQTSQKEARHNNRCILRSYTLRVGRASTRGAEDCDTVWRAGKTGHPVDGKHDASSCKYIEGQHSDRCGDEKNSTPQCAFKISMFNVSAIHINSRSLLRFSSIHEPSDPPLRIVSFCRSRSDN